MEKREWVPIEEGSRMRLTVFLRSMYEGNTPFFLTISSFIFFYYFHNENCKEEKLTHYGIPQQQ